MDTSGVKPSAPQAGFVDPPPGGMPLPGMTSSGADVTGSAHVLPSVEQPPSYTESLQQGSRGNPQGYPQGYPQGNPQAYPQGYPQGNPQGYPQGYPQGNPQGYPHGYPQGNPQGYPQGNPQGYPQGNPQGYPQGYPQCNPQGYPPAGYNPQGYQNQGYPSTVTPQGMSGVQGKPLAPGTGVMVTQAGHGAVGGGGGAPQAGPCGQVNTTPVIVMQPTAQGLPRRPVKDKEWERGLCGCCSNCGLCLMSCFCSCIVMGKNAKALGESCPLFCICSLVPFGRCILEFVLRGNIRDRRGIKGSECNDCCSVLCCHLCALTQEANEVRSMVKSDEINRR